MYASLPMEAEEIVKVAIAQYQMKFLADRDTMKSKQTAICIYPKVELIAELQFYFILFLSLLRF